MAHYEMIIDAEKCIGCSNCIVACKDEYVGNEYLPLSTSQPDTGHLWMKVNDRERGSFPHVKVAYTPVPCLHCEDAPCVKAAAAIDGAVYTRPDGIVIIDPIKARGQKQLVDACPFGVIYWNEEKNVAQKCTFCAHRLEGGGSPRCVESCPVDAIIFGDVDDPNSEISKRKKSSITETLKPELGIKTHVNYIGLPKTFMAGSIVLGDNQECGKGAMITAVNGSGQVSGSTTASPFGEFEIDGLSTGNDYTLKIELKGYRSKNIEVKLESDNYLGEIILEKQ